MRKQTIEEIMKDYRILSGTEGVKNEYHRAILYEASLKEPQSTFERNVRMLELSRKRRE
jgi:hypothetical protein